MIYILTGVSGVGKTTMGKLLSRELNLPFYDADDFHSAENVEKMNKGIPLQDEDRESWLITLAKNIETWERNGGAVLACSALKEKYRKTLQVIPNEDICWIFLHSEYEIIEKRILARENHYFNPELLQTQYSALEFPGYGIHINVNNPKERILEEIMDKLHHKKSKIGILGLGVMGKSLALNFASNGINTAVFNRHVENLEVDIAKNFAEENKKIFAFPWFQDLEEFVSSLETPRNVFLMVNAGKTIDIVIESLLPFLEKNDLIIDGGNSHFKDTIRREQYLKEKGILFMGTGVSGGEEGARNGPSIMPGGARETYERVGKLLEIIAAKDYNGNPCCAYIGPDGSGHFVKMVHNGIEYGEMQIIAEAYQYLRFAAGKEPDEIAEILSEWNNDMKSYLLEINIKILKTKEGDSYLIDKVLDAAKQKGTGGWSTNAGLELGVSLDTITAAVMARNISAKKELRLKAMEIYEKDNSQSSLAENIPANLFSAFKTAGIINHAIGFDLLAEASKSYDWDLDLAEISRIWTNGCIIRSRLMEDLINVFKDSPDHLLLHPDISSRVYIGKKALTAFSVTALQSGIPVPVFSAAANYLLSFTSGQSSANIIQAQRDFFGAHTYERTDKPRGEFFHTIWKENS